MTMASSKKNLTEKQSIIEGLMDKILGRFLMGRTKNVLNLIQHDKNLANATKKLEKSSAEWKKALRKSIEISKKSDSKADRELSKKLGL